jgi:hypothetical protein
MLPVVGCQLTQRVLLVVGFVIPISDRVVGTRVDKLRRLVSTLYLLGKGSIKIVVKGDEKEEVRRSSCLRGGRNDVKRFSVGMECMWESRWESISLSH